MSPVRLIGPVSLAAVITACGAAQSGTTTEGTAQRVTVTAREMSFSPATVEVQAGQPVMVTLTNGGSVAHDWQIKLGSPGGTSVETIKIIAVPGRSANQTFTVLAPGTYEVICTVPGHAQLGMVGTLVAR